MISVLSYLSHLLSLTCVIRTIVADEAAVGGEVVEPEVEGVVAGEAVGIVAGVPVMNKGD